MGRDPLNVSFLTAPHCSPFRNLFHLSVWLWVFCSPLVGRLFVAERFLCAYSIVFVHVHMNKETQSNFSVTMPCTDMTIHNDEKFRVFIWLKWVSRAAKMWCVFRQTRLVLIVIPTSHSCGTVAQPYFVFIIWQTSCFFARLMILFH